MTSNYKLTRAVCFSGYVTQSVTVNLAPLLFVCFQNLYGISLSYVAFITFLTFFVQIIIDLLAVKVIEKLTFRFISISSQLCSFLGLICLAFLPRILNPFVGIIVSVIIYSSGSALAEVSLSPLIDAIPDDKPNGASMSLVHSFYSWGQAFVVLVTTFAFKLTGATFWWILPLIWSVIPLYNTVMFTFIKLPPMKIGEKGSSSFAIFKSPLFIVCFILMICAGAAEQAVAQWASLFAEEGLGVTKIIGDVLGPCTFALMMGIGRTFQGIFVKKIPLYKFLLVLSGFTSVCFLLLVFSPSPIVSLIACGLSGLGVSVMWPGMLSYTSDTFPKAGSSMMAILALGGDIGCTAGPYLTGKVSDLVISNFTSDASVGLRAGFLCATVFPLLMVIGMLVMIFKNKSRKDTIKS